MSFEHRQGFLGAGISGSSFPVSENAVAPDRLAEAVAVHRAGRTP